MLDVADCDFVDPAVHTDNLIISADASRRGEDEPGNLDVGPVIHMSPTDLAKPRATVSLSEADPRQPAAPMFR